MMKPQPQLRVGNFLNKLGITIIFAYFSLFLFFLGYYIHEFGHILFGMGNRLLLGEKLSGIVISNWISHPLTPFLKIPQQTRILNGNGSVNFILGGIILSILFWIFFSWVLYKGSKQKISLLIPLLIFIGEITGNYFCGTDNLTNNPLASCNNFGLIWFVRIEPYIFMILLTIIFLRSNLFRKIVRFLEEAPLKINRRLCRTKSITSLKRINLDDPEKEKKMAYISGVNRISDLINRVSRDIENKILIFVSIFFSALLGALLTAGMYLQATLTLGILCTIIVIAIFKEVNDKKNLQNQMDSLVKQAKEKTGLDLRQN